MAAILNSIVLSKTLWDAEGANVEIFIKHKVVGLLSQIILLFCVPHIVPTTSKFNWFLDVLLSGYY
jgi:uncharacterized membrane protein YwzB